MTDTNKLDEMTDEEFFNLVRNQSGYKSEIQPQSSALLGDFVAAKIPEQKFLKTVLSDLKNKYSNVNTVGDSGGNITGFEFVGDSGQKESINLDNLRKERQKYIESNLQEDHGSNVWDRIMISLPKTAKGAYSILGKKYGEENVIPERDRNERVINFFIKNEDGTFKRLNKKGFDFGDIAGLAGPAIENIPGVVASTLAASKKLPTLGAGAVGDIVGTVARQGAAEIAGAGNELTPTERLAEGAVNVLGGAAGEAVTVGGKKALQESRFSPFFQEQRSKKAFRDKYLYEGRGSEPYQQAVKEGQRIEKNIEGLELTAPQMTMSSTALGEQSRLYQNPMIGGQIAEFRNKQIDVLTKNVEDEITKIAGGKFTPIEAGQNVVDAISTARAAILKQRSEVARPLFERIDKVAGNQPVIKLDNTMKAIDEIAADLEGNFTTGSTQKIISQLNSMRESFLKGQTADTINTKTIRGQVPAGKTGLGEFRSTAKKFQRDMSNLSKVLYGQGRLVDDIPVSQDQFMAKKLLKAMERDLDVSVSGGGIAGEAATAISEARAAWAASSRKFEELNTKPIEMIMKMNDAGNIEQLGKKFAKGISNENIKKTMAQISAIDQDSANKLRASAIQEKLANLYTGDKIRAGSLGSLFGEKGAPNRPGTGDINEFFSSIFQGDARGAIETKRIIQKFADLSDAGKRVSAQGIGGRGGSQTGILMALVDFGKKSGFEIFPKTMEQVGLLFNKLGDEKNMAKVLVDPVMRADLLGLVDPPKWAKATFITKTATRLLDSLAATDDKKINENRMEPEQ